MLQYSSNMDFPKRGLVMRRRVIYFVSALLCAPGAAFSQAACSDGLTDLFVAESYTASAKSTGYSDGVELDVILHNGGDRDVRMIDGSIIFQDVLDRDILRIGIDPDMHVKAGETGRQNGIYSNTRLLDVDQEDVVVTTCIRGLVYSDGEVLKAGG